MDLKQLIREEIKIIFESNYAPPMLDVVQGTDSEMVGDEFPFGYQGFNDEPDGTRKQMANDKYNELLKQFDGNEEKALENMPEYMLFSL